MLKRLLRLGFLWICLATLEAAAGLSPETIAVAFNRDEGETYANTNTYISGTTLLFTNCTALVSAGVTQDLTDVFVVLRIGNDKTNYTYAASSSSPTNGSFYGLVTIPTHAALVVPVEVETQVRVQCTLTNAAGVSFTYRGSKLLTVRSGLSY